MNARLKILGGPVAVCGKPPWSAVWQTDEITAHLRVGSHWLCTVRYGWDNSWLMLAWIPKKWLRVSTPEPLMWAQ